MTNGLQLNESTPVAGLGTWTYTVVTAGLYSVKTNFTIPYQPAGSSNNSASTAGQSGLTITLKQNTTTLVTAGGSSANPTPNQPTLGASTTINAAAGDTISVVTSSSNAVDQGLNAIKGIVNLYSGE